MSATTYLLILPIFLAFMLIDGFSRLESPLVETSVGKIRGVRANDGPYYKFMGIPYAKVEEDNPFGPSIPYPDFKDVFDTGAGDTVVCPQIGYDGVIDCLQLHIYVPDTINQTLPVMVWIHGGSFDSGSGGQDWYGPKYLVRHNIILVSLNYRLGPYGFMCLDDPKVPGNQGLKDQLLALRWIKNNIEAFGGDIHSITISGESGGGMSVDLHLLFNKENLFNRVIMQSGTGLSAWIKWEPDVQAPLKLAAHLGFETKLVKDALSYLEKQNSSVIIQAAKDILLRFVPCVEKDLNVERYITTHPMNAKMPNPNISILIGTTDDESLYVYAHNNLSAIGNMFEFELESTFNFGKKLSVIENIVRNFYIGDENISNDVIEKVIDFDSDFIFNHPTQRSINKYVRNGAEVYQYIFSYLGQRNLLKRIFNITFGGACHADELGYLFDISNFKQELVTTEDALMIDRITTLWTNFIKYGNPMPNTPSELRWIPVTENNMFYLDLDSELKLKRRPFQERSAFWDLFYEAYGKFQKGYENYE